MRHLTATICITLAVLLGSADVSWSADYQKGLTAAKSGDFATALREWKPLAEQGNVNAQYGLGYMYANGKGVPQDYKTAVKWYRRAAEQGNARAQEKIKKLQQKIAKKIKQQELERKIAEQNKQRERQKKIAEQNKLRELQARANQGNSNAQYQLGTMYGEGEGVPQDDKIALKWTTLAAKQGNASAQYKLGLRNDNPQNYETAMKWYRLAAKQENSNAQKRYGELLLQDFVYGSDIRKLENLGKAVKTLCKGNIKCAFDKVWAYLDITGDARLSLAEIARFQRNIVKFAAVHQDQNVLKTEEIAAINLTSIIFLPITASSILHSFDYNNDGVLAKNEVFGDTEFSKLVGVNVNTLATGLDFQSLGEKLQGSLNQIPFLK